MMSDKEGGMLRRCWRALWRPSVKYTLATLLLAGFIAGVLFWGAFNWAMELTNTETFCISCHEMYDNVYQEYRNTIHYANRTGVRATCPDCHVPKEWIHKVVRKVRATNELYHKALGSISTAEKFAAKRLELAQHVWTSMKATDSRECRNCHDFESMDYTRQGRRGATQHAQGFNEGKTCIDCHKGIAHRLPDMHEVDPSSVVGAGNGGSAPER
jgi:cytochrome c-type protein NapC